MRGSWGACPHRDPKELEADSQPTGPPPTLLSDAAKTRVGLVLQRPAPGGPHTAPTPTGAVQRVHKPCWPPPPHPPAAVCRPFCLPESPPTSSTPITKPQLRPYACWPCQVSSSLLLLSQQRGLCWAHLDPSRALWFQQRLTLSKCLCGRTPSIHRVLSWPGGLRALGPSLTLALPQGPPPPLGFRGLEGPSTGRKAGLARARPWGQTQPPPPPRPLHAGSSGIQPPACPPSSALRPQGTAAVRDGEDSSVRSTEEGSAWSLPCPDCPPKPQSLSRGKVNS